MNMCVLPTYQPCSITENTLNGAKQSHSNVLNNNYYPFLRYRHPTLLTRQSSLAYRTRFTDVVKHLLTITKSGSHSAARRLPRTTPNSLVWSELQCEADKWNMVHLQREIRWTRRLFLHFVSSLVTTLSMSHSKVNMGQINKISVLVSHKKTV